jgi:hypothetical protein
MLTNFYVGFSPACFTLLGLWLTIITINAPHWVHGRYQQQAYAVALYFAAPGTMSLLALINSTSTILWRIVFTAISALGILGLFVFGPLHHRGPHTWVEVTDHLVHFMAILLYLGIVVLAWIPFHVLGYEGGLLTFLVLIGIHVAMRMLFAAGEPSSDESGTREPGPSASQHLPVGTRDRLTS